MPYCPWRRKYSASTCSMSRAARTFADNFAVAGIGARAVCGELLILGKSVIRHTPARLDIRSRTVTSGAQKYEVIGGQVGWLRHAGVCD